MTDFNRTLRDRFLRNRERMTPALNRTQAEQRQQRAEQERRAQEQAEARQAEADELARRALQAGQAEARPSPWGGPAA